MTMYIGMDVHSKFTQYYAQDDEGKEVGKGRVPTSQTGFDEMLTTLNAPAQTWVGFETGGQSTWVSRLFSAMDMHPVVIDAREVRAKALRARQKSDSRDAFEICDGLRRGIYSSIVYVPEVNIERLRRILSRRRHFVNASSSEISAVKFLLRSVGLAHEVAHLNNEGAWEKLLGNQAVRELRNHLELHCRVWKACRESVKDLEKELEEAMQPFEKESRRLQTVPWVGKITVATFIAVIGTPTRFENSGRVASYTGLVPSSWDTGDRVRHGHITKCGSSELRSMLCEVAHHARRPDHPLNPYFTRMIAQAGYKKAIVCVAHRLARILYQMWRTKKDFDERKLGVEKVMQKVTKTRHYAMKRPLREETHA